MTLARPYLSCLLLALSAIAVTAQDAPAAPTATAERDLSQTAAADDPQIWLVVVAMAPTAETFDLAGYTDAMRRKYPKSWLPDYANWKAKNHQFAFYVSSSMHAIGVFEQTGAPFNLILSSAQIRMVPRPAWDRVKTATLAEMVEYETKNPLE